jgi:hypothetical protein
LRHGSAELPGAGRDSPNALRIGNHLLDEKRRVREAGQYSFCYRCHKKIAKSPQIL